MPLVSPYLDPCQYGLKGASISHYLIKLLQFVHEYLDLKNPHAVVVALVDLSKAFNRVSHQMVIEDLHDMHVPPWLLLILISYLTERSMIMQYKGETSSPRDLPGSSPQGAFLGIFFFIVKYNAASLRPPIPRILLMSAFCRVKKTKCKKTNCVRHVEEMHALYIDDLSEAEAIELKKKLIKDPVQRPYPLNYHERTEHIFPSDKSTLQKQLYNVENFTKNNLMKINASKSKVMIFNKSRKYDFPPEYSFSDGQFLEVLGETKLLGIQISSDLRWFSNTKAIYTKAMSRMWLLRRMKLLKLEPETILDFYLKEIRSITEQGVAVWNSGLTKGQINDLEKIQKVALKIILADHYTSYEFACTLFNIQNLSERRNTLSINFAVKLFQSDRSDQFYTPSYIRDSARHDQPLVVENHCVTVRCYNAPHNYLARLVNQNKARIKTPK